MAHGDVIGGLVQADGVDWYRIDGVERMEPFLMSVVSSSDLWMFASSRGSLTAGRIDPDNAFLPYETDDRIHRAVGITGPVTIVARTFDGRRQLWRPFGAEIGDGVRRSLAKSVLGDRLMFEETNPAWGLTYRATWMPAPSFGWVRHVDLINTSDSGMDLEVLDGLLDVNPFGVDADVEQERSNLVDAYKRSETGRWHTLAIYTLESLITDQAEPAEALGATVIWSYGGLPEIHLDERVLQAMADGTPRPTSDRLLGRRGSYLLRGNLSLTAGVSASWGLVADSGLDHSEVQHRTGFAGDSGAIDSVHRDVAAGSERLHSLLAGADGFQRTGDRIADVHHLSNVLFNVMRGGLLPHGHRIPVAELVDHLERWNRDVWERHAGTIGQLGDWVEAEKVRSAAVDTGDPHLIRLVLEYLPLAFSRRHGDPSRPWNRFSIRVGNQSDGDLYAYEGNWRDIFQNWEALMASHPAFVPNAVAKFVNASTTDGHNPYRITQDGIDWEVPDAHDPWSNIGYWGDHQIVYLHRLLELWERMDPGGVSSWLDKRVFVYADVPYSIAGHADMVRDPRNTITFDWERENAVEARVDRIGADGRLVVGADGEIVRVSLIEKLLVPVLAKLSSFVPGGGIWMNTQRPEWNDANNALAGYGLSMVTLYYLRGYLEMLRETVLPEVDTELPFSTAVARWLADVTDVLQRFGGEDCHVDPGSRRVMVDALGGASDHYRKTSRESFDATPVRVEASALSDLVEAAIVHLDHSIGVGRRSDGLYDSYNVVSFPTGDEARVGRLGPMLEGQVAVLSSGALDSGRAVGVIEALYESDMYREDQDSFMLYPVRHLPAFLDGNEIRGDDPVVAPLAAELGHAGVLVGNAEGGFHFTPDMINAVALAGALEGTSLDSSQRVGVLDRYEELFGHHEYTGRSGSMYGYEGIGSIYWHMVGKLLVAVQETYWRAVDSGSEHVAALAQAYRRIRAGLGFCKDPLTYGAIPTDCYSHTPSHSGAKQPGMTGQVKEEILTRFGELGLRVEGGVISLDPGLLEIDQLVPNGAEAEFTYCGTRFLIGRGIESQTRVSRSGHWDEPISGLRLPSEVSTDILRRTGTVDSVEFTILR